jgi:charged multivesicular body protein 7
LPSLYSDFRNLKTTNPNGFDANVAAWKAVLADACKAGKFARDKLVLSVSDDLVSALHTQDWGRPLALGVAVAEAVQSKDLYPLDTFMSQATSIYHWSYAGAALNWGLTRLGLRGPANSTRGITSGKFVVIRNVEDVAKTVTQAMMSRRCDYSLADRIFTADLFASELVPDLSPTDVQVLLRHLSRDAAVCAYDGATVKFKAPGELATQITETDTTIAHLKSLLKSLHARVDTLSADITACTARAKAAVEKSNRPVALAALKSRKTAETALNHQVKALGQVEDVMTSIQTAAGNIELVRILERSSKVLSGLNKEIGGVERVDEVMERLKNETDAVEEVNRVLAEAGTVVDEEEVEDELEALMKETEEKERAERVKEQLATIPPVVGEMERQLSETLESIKLGEEKGKEQEREQVHA